MISESHEPTNPVVRRVEFFKNGQNCGFNLTRGKWDPYPWICSVETNSVSELAGVKEGECLLSVNGKDVVGEKISDIAEFVKNGSDRVILLVWNSGNDPACHPENLCCGPLPQSLLRLSACMKTILAYMECPICLDTVTPTTCQCDNGHLICIKCRALSERCPVCRVRLNRGRSLLADQVYYAVIDAFDLRKENNETRSKKIQQIFNPKSVNKTVPNIKITPCHTSKFFSKILGKSSSVDNLATDNKFLSATNGQSLKMKSLSSDEIWSKGEIYLNNSIATPVPSNAGSLKSLNYFNESFGHNGMQDSLTNISGFELRINSAEGSSENLSGNFFINDNDVTAEVLSLEEPSYFCPFEEVCPELIQEGSIIQHFQTHHKHNEPLVQYFGGTVNVPIRRLEKEVCLMDVVEGNTFFIRVKPFWRECQPRDLLIWCWYLGPQVAAKNYTMEVNFCRFQGRESVLKLKTPVASLKTTSSRDIIDAKDGVFVSCKLLQLLQLFEDLVLHVNIL